MSAQPQGADRPLLLHDGRAHTLAEAIQMHGGQAEASANAFRSADPASQAALLDFLGCI